MLPKERIPKDYNPSVFTRIIEDLYNKVNGVVKGVVDGLNALSKRVDAIESEIGPSKVPAELPSKAPVVHAYHVWRFVITWVERPLIYKIFQKGFNIFEWHLTMQDDSAADFTPTDTTFKRYSLMGRVILFADEQLSPGKAYFVKCRSVTPFRGSQSSWSSTVKALSWGSLADDDVPPVWSGTTLVVNAFPIFNILKRSRWCTIKLRFSRATDDNKMGHYQVFWKRHSDDDSGWTGRIFDCNADGWTWYSNNHTYCYAHLLGPFIRNEYYDFQVVGVDKAGNKTETSLSLSNVQCNPDIGTPGDVAVVVIDTGVDGHEFFRKAWATIGLKAADIDNYAIDRVKVKRRIHGFTAWSGFHQYSIDDCEIETVSGTDYYIIRLDNLFQGRTYDVNLRYRDIDLQWSNNQTHTSLFTTDSESVMNLSQLTDVLVLAIPSVRSRRHKTSWNILFSATLPSSGLAYRFQFKISKLVKLFGIPLWMSQLKSVEYNPAADGGTAFSAMFPIQFVPDTDAAGANTGIYVNVRAWYQGKSGVPYKQWSWTSGENPITLGWAQAVITTPQPSDASAPELTWRQLIGRWVLVNPFNDPSWVPPENFSHIEVYASTASTAVMNYSYQNRIAVIHTDTPKYVPVWIPWRVYDETTGKHVWCLRLTNIKLWAVPCVYTYDSNNKLVTSLVSAASSAVLTGDEDPTDPFGDQFVITKRVVAVFNGDVLYAPCAKLNENYTISETSIKIAKEAGEDCPFSIGDLLVLGEHDANFATPGHDFNSTNREVMKVLDVQNPPLMPFSYLLTVSRGYKNSPTSGRIGQVLVKCGQANSTWRFVWFDAVNCYMRVVEAVDNGSSVSWTTVARYGATSESFYAVAAILKTNAGAGSTTSGVVLNSTGLKGYKNSSTASFYLSTDGKLTLTSPSSGSHNLGTLNITGSTISGTDITISSAKTLTIDTSAGESEWKGGTIRITASVLDLSGTGRIIVSKPGGIEVPVGTSSSNTITLKASDTYPAYINFDDKSWMGIYATQGTDKGSFWIPNPYTTDKYLSIGKSDATWSYIRIVGLYCFVSGGSATQNGYVYAGEANGGYLYCGATNYVSLGSSGAKVGFFSAAGTTRQTINRLSSGANQAQIIDKVNELLGVLHGHNLINSPS